MLGLQGRLHTRARSLEVGCGAMVSRSLSVLTSHLI